MQVNTDLPRDIPRIKNPDSSVKIQIEPQTVKELTTPIKTPGSKRKAEPV